MQLTSLLNPKLIYYEDRELTKEQILKTLIDKICASFKFKNCSERIMDLVIKREAESPTVYPTGMAIPHVRIDGLDDTIIAVCIPRKPIVDNEQEVKIYILILTDKNVSSLYLNVVAAFMRISKDKELFKTLLDAKDAHAFINHIKDAAIKVKDEVIVSDVMTPNPHVINQNETLKSAAVIMNENRIHFLPVVDDNGDWVGEINILRYLKISLPDFMLMIDNLNFLRNFEPFERLYNEEEKVLVKDVMLHPEKNMKPDFSIIEAVFEMIQQNKQYFSVVKDKKVVGVITAMDIYRKVVRA